MENIKAYSDIVVKFLLGREETKDILISFINAVMEDSGLDLISSVELKNPFNIQDFTEDKLSILDVKAIDETGKTIDIEIQSRGDMSFANRSLYYWSKLYTSQIAESETYKRLKPVCCINLLNFRLLEDIEKFHSCYVLKEKDEPDKILTDHLILHFIELPKVGKNMVKSSLEMWSQYFINEGGDNNIMKTLLKDEPIIEKAHNEFKKFTADEHLREIYESRLKAKRDYTYFMEVAREEGLKEGLEQAVIETAQKMLADGLAVEVISKYTGLSVEKINSLKLK